MAYSRVVALGNGSTTQFAVNFALDFLLETDVTCRVGNEVDGSGQPLYRTVTFLSTNLLQISGAAPAAGVKVVFTRTVDKTALRVNYQDGDQIDDQNLTISQKQLIMAVHEALDGRIGPLTQDIDAGGNTITNLKEPTDPTDAVTKNYVETAENSILVTALATLNAAADAAVGEVDGLVTEAHGVLADTQAASAAASASETSAAASAAAAAASAEHAHNNYVVDTFIGNGVTTAFSLTVDPGGRNNCFVNIDGVTQLRSSFSVSGTTITFSEAPPSLAVIEVAYGSSLEVGVPSDGSVGQSKLAFTVTNYALTLLDDATAAEARTTLGVDTLLATKADLASPTFTGAPVAPTAAPGTNTTQVATTAFAAAADTALQGTINTALGLKANLASPALTGTPTAPTAAFGTNTTQIATTAFVLANAGVSVPRYGIGNQAIAVSASGGALTIALKDAAGNDPSPSSPVVGYFRSGAGSASGSLDQLSVTSALSIVVPSGAQLGVTSATAFRLWVVLFNDAGTPRLGVINCANATTIFPLNEGLITTSVAISAGAASAGVFYTGTAVTKAFLIVGYIDWGPAGLTAGTWTTTNLLYVQSFGPGIKKPGDIVQTAMVTSASGSSTTSTTPVDVIGATRSIALTSAPNRVRVIAQGSAAVAAAGAGTNSQISSYLLRTASVIAQQLVGVVSGGGTNMQSSGGISLVAFDWPNTTASITYKLQHNTTIATGAATTASVVMILEEVMV